MSHSCCQSSISLIAVAGRGESSQECHLKAFAMEEESHQAQEGAQQRRAA